MYFEQHWIYGLSRPPTWQDGPPNTAAGFRSIAVAATTVLRCFQNVR